MSDTDKKMLVDLRTQAKDLPGNVEKTIYKMKSTMDFKEKVKALGGVTKDDLAHTYAFLIDSTIDDSNVAQLKQEGLKKMISLRIYQLMPQFCFTHNGKLF